MATKSRKTTKPIAEHTPGPWTYQFDEGAFEINSGSDSPHDNGPWSAVAAAWANRLGSREVDPSEAEANARLIAAAPDLLDALTSLVERVETAGWHRTETEFARAAIAKATGS